MDLSNAHAKLTDESFCLFAKRLTRCEVLSLARVSCHSGATTRVDSDYIRVLV